MENETLQKAIEKLYLEILDEYWDPECRFIDENYQTIPFPFEEMNHPDFQIQNKWNREQLLGYLNTWSAVRHYVDKHELNPIDLILHEIPDFDSVNVTFPILIRIGKTHQNQPND